MKTPYKVGIGVGIATAVAFVCGGVLANIVSTDGGEGAVNPVPTTIVSAEPSRSKLTTVDEPSRPTSTKPEPVRVEDGTWTVGVDIPAGSYRVTTNVTDGCYWAITKSGSNGNDILANDLPSGGRPQVTLKKGQDFETEDCGTWSKIK